MSTQGRENRFFRILLAAGLALCCLLSGCGLAETAETAGEAEAAETAFVENEYNYVDGSMDITGGIPDSASGVLDRIRRKGVLRVATEPYFAPQEFIDPDLTGQDRYVGADMELARLIARRMGVKLEIVPLEFSAVLPALNDDTCDLAISALSYTPARASAYTLSKGYYFTESTANVGMIIRAEDAEEIRVTADLAKRTIVAQSGSLQEALAAEMFDQYMEFRRVSTTQAVYDAVAGGRADAGVVDMETAETYIENNPGCGLVLTEAVQVTLDEWFQGDRVAARQGEMPLMYFVNAVIDEVLAGGQYLQWMERYGRRAAELGL